MLSDFTGAEKVYICCGYTDLRQGIDGLSALVKLELDLDPFSNTLFLSADDAETESKRCTGQATASCCCIRVWQLPMAPQGK